MSCKHALGTFGPNTTCYFGCHAGFTLMGDRALRCTPSGQWTVGTPACRGNGERGRQFWSYLPAGTHVQRCSCLLKSHPTPGTTSRVGFSMKSTPVPARGNLLQACHFSPCCVIGECLALKDVKEETLVKCPNVWGKQACRAWNQVYEFWNTSCNSINYVIVWTSHISITGT